MEEMVKTVRTVHTVGLLYFYLVGSAATHLHPFCALPTIRYTYFTVAPLRVILVLRITRVD